MPTEEAERLRRHPDVLWVEQDSVVALDGSQSNPGWALDRIDEASSVYDNNYSWTYTGAGQTVYILDSGLDIGAPYLTAEFGSRASVIHDFNPGGTGQDCTNHGTPVASLVAGKTFGVAKGATIIMAKISNLCTRDLIFGMVAESLNWLAMNAPAGTTVNMSIGTGGGVACPVSTNKAIKDGVISAVNAGILIFASAGNDNCDVGNIDWKNIPETFVVGGLIYAASLAFDLKWPFSNWGANISAWAPAIPVAGLSDDGVLCASMACTFSGTSFASPIVAGIAAVACQSIGGCGAPYNVLDLYTALKNTGTMGTVKEAGGVSLIGSPSRVIWQQW
jgi:subtilisin family serine protease